MFDAITTTQVTIRINQSTEREREERGSEKVWVRWERGEGGREPVIAL